LKNPGLPIGVELVFGDEILIGNIAWDLLSASTAYES